MELQKVHDINLFAFTYYREKKNIYESILNFLVRKIEISRLAGERLYVYWLILFTTGGSRNLSFLNY